MKVEVEAPPPYEDQPLDPQTLRLDISEHGSHNFLFSVFPPKETEKGEKDDNKRAPIDLCCVVDVSGSMSTSAPAPGGTENTGLNVLDVVKHAIKTIVASMGEGMLSSLMETDSALDDCMCR